MRKRLTKQQKFDLIMECRTSGLSDFMWCKSHDVSASTFYSWVKQLKIDGAQFPERTHAESYHCEQKPDIVKLEVVDENPSKQLPEISSVTSSNCAIEITIGGASIKVFNDANPMLLSQVMSCMGGTL